MAERITWEQIDASPLLALPCEERARLRETGDERFRAFGTPATGHMSLKNRIRTA